MKFALISLMAIVLVGGCRKVKPEAPAEGYGVAGGLITSGAAKTESGRNIANLTSPLGMTLAEFGASTSEWIAIDQMVQAEDWQEVPCSALPAEATNPGSGTQVIDSIGWVDQLPSGGNCVGTRLFQHMKGDYPSGTYLVKFAGGATITVSGDASEVKVVGVGLATFEVEKPTTDGVLLKLSALRVGDQIRSIQVIAPGGVCGASKTELNPFSFCSTDRGGQGSCSKLQTCYDFADVAIDPYTTGDAKNFVSLVTDGSKVFFHPTFLASLQNYRSLNFRRWLMLEGQAPFELARLNSNLAHFAPHLGAPVPVIVAASNLLHADPWITLAADISDPVVSAIASEFAQNLDSTLVPYLEYAGEYWVQGSFQRNYMESQVSAGSFPSLEHFYLARSEEIVNLWRSAFSADAARLQIVEPVDAADLLMHERVRVAGNGHTPFTILAMGMHFTLPTASGTDEASLAPFFSSIGGDSFMTPTSEIGKASQLAIDMGNLARGAGLTFVAYGVGPVIESSLGVSDPRETARTDSRMGTMMTRQLEAWKDAGGTLAFFDKSADDSDSASTTPWGALKSQQDYESQLSQALSQFIMVQTCWWSNCEKK